MSVIDAGVWISGMVTGDVNNKVPAAWLDRVNEAGLSLIVPAIFPAEVSGVIRRDPVANYALGPMLETLFDSDFFEIYELTIVLSRFAAEVAGEGALRGADAVYVALAADLELPLVTWDRQQRERGALFCRTMTPVEAMEMSK